jgi:hypothetical protein
MAYLYRHIRLDTNEVFYVGIGTYLKRCFDKTRRNKFWKNIISKTKYRVDIVFQDIPREEAIIKEIEFIALYGRRDLGLGTLVNLTNGGDSGGGEQNKGRVFTNEHIQKLKYACKFKPPMSIETRKKLSNSKMGHIVTEETRKKLSLINKGKKTNPWSEEQKVKNKNFWKSKINKLAQYDLEMNLIKIWDNRILASEELGIKKDYIRECLRNRRKQVNGFIFKPWAELETKNI